MAQIADEEAREARIAKGAVSLSMIEKAMAETPADFFRQLVEDLQQCQEEHARLTAVLDEKCGSQAPPTSNIRSALASCLKTVTALAREKLTVASAAPEAAEETSTALAAPSVNGPAVVGGPVRSREEAFQVLLLLAEFFRRTEPHTPVSYALEQVVRWGRMSLPELLTELIPEESSRTQFFRFVGIRPPKQS